MEGRLRSGRRRFVRKDEKYIQFVAIILDTTNIVQAGFDLGSLSLALLREFARHRDQQLILPDIVVEELRNKRLDSVRSDLQSLTTALGRVRRFHDLAEISLPDEHQVVKDWIEWLGKIFQIEQVTGNEARAALYRDAQGVAPAEHKGGARDAAIWEVVKRVHLSSQEVTYFVSHNSRDFGDPKEATRLHPDLLTELDGEADRLTYLRTIDDVLAEFGQRVEREVTVLALDEMNESGLLSAAVAGWTQVYAGSTAFEKARQLGFRNVPSSITIGVGEALPVAVESSQTYQLEDTEVTIADTRFQLSFTVYLAPSEEVDAFNIAGDLNIRLLIREGADQSITAEVLEGGDATLTPFLRK